MTKLYILERNGAVGYDEAAAVIVRARSPQAARSLAAQAAKNERAHVWQSTVGATCRELRAEGDEEIILQDVNWG